MFTILDPAEVERRLEELIVKHKSKNISVTDIKRRIFEAGSEDVMREINLFNKWWMQCFARQRDGSEFEVLIEAFQDAWNTFPHSSLEGKSPQDVMQEEMEKNPQKEKSMNENAMPPVTVGGETMSWDDYLKMIKKMEKLQKPFKRWIEEKALPGYRTFLETKFKTKKSVDKHYDVADHFFRRALSIGFLDFEQIRPDFAVWEFPDWWQSHILYSNLTEEQVWSSLCDFFWFAEFILHRSIPGVWEAAGMEDASPDDSVDPPAFALSLTPKIGRNDPCSCGAVKADWTPVKYKHCHGKS